MSERSTEEDRNLRDKGSDTVSLKEYTDLRIVDTIMASNQRFEAQQLALKDALLAQEKAVAAALESTREAIGKAEIATDKRFDLLSEKIDGVNEMLNKNAGAQGIYVTHTDLSTEMEKLRTSFESMLRPVVTFMNSSTGSSKGRNDMWGYVVGGIGFIIAVVSFIIMFTHID